jgi:NAD(P)-dependent dehydrogenase (short-subunit alcohol dehydrogenase family)
MQLDLDDLKSVRKFSLDFLRRYSRLDILINNAGLVAQPGAETKQGLEQSFGAMHLGHFALTKYLLRLLLKPLPHGQSGAEAARVVNIASDGMLAGNFHPTLMSGSGGGDLSREMTDNCGFAYGVQCCPLLPCPYTNGYSRAKLANVLHAYELQRRVDEYISEHSKIGSGARKFRRLVTASLHPGTVHTNIASLLANKIVGLMLRSSDQAAYIIMHAILEDSFVPSSYIDGLRKPHDLFNYREKHLQNHLNAFPAARSLPFAEESKVDDKHSLHRLFWTSQSLIKPNIGEVVGVELFRKDAVAGRLWDVSEQLLRDWEAGKPMFTTPVPVGRRPPKLRL